MGTPRIRSIILQRSKRMISAASSALQRHGKQTIPSLPEQLYILHSSSSATEVFYAVMAVRKVRNTPQQL